MRKVLEKVTNFRAARPFKQFAAKLHFVYFGRVSIRDDEHQVIRGVTASTKHTDDHFTVGTFEGHDVAIVARRTTLQFPGKQSSSYHWLIAQVDLKRSHLPHMFIDFSGHDATFYANMAIGFTKLRDMTPGFSDLGARVLIDPNAYGEARMVLAPHISNGLREHFDKFAIEIVDDQLFVYGNGARVSLASLENILKLATWLAASLNVTH